jgi:hypothetical protein
MHFPWIIRSHPQLRTEEPGLPSRRLYERAGLRLVKSEHHRSFGKTLTGQTWDLTL